MNQQLNTLLSFCKNEHRAALFATITDNLSKLKTSKNISKDTPFEQCPSAIIFTNNSEEFANTSAIIVEAQHDARVPTLDEVLYILFGANWELIAMSIASGMNTDEVMDFEGATAEEKMKNAELAGLSFFLNVIKKSVQTSAYFNMDKCKICKLFTEDELAADNFLDLDKAAETLKMHSQPAEEA